MTVFSPLEDSDLCDVSLLENGHGDLKTVESTRIKIVLSNAELHNLINNHLLARKFNSTRTFTGVTFFEDVENAFSFEKYIISLMGKER